MTVKCGMCGNDEYIIKPCDIEIGTLDTIYEIKCKVCFHVIGRMKFTDIGSD